MLLTLTTGLSLWVCYGLLKRDVVLAIANGVAITLTGTVLSCKPRDTLSG